MKKIILIMKHEINSDKINDMGIDSNFFFVFSLKRSIFKDS